MRPNLVTKLKNFLMEKQFLQVHGFRGEMPGPMFKKGQKADFIVLQMEEQAG